MQLERGVAGAVAGPHLGGLARAEVGGVQRFRHVSAAADDAGDAADVGGAQPGRRHGRLRGRQQYGGGRGSRRQHGRASSELAATAPS